ncbi:MAG: serine/threonine protein kinase [Candidatus Riflebacteria bacterium]|nr:serine/threonine protein kinase [Candidatus Riflebacteria bacterium]
MPLGPCPVCQHPLSSADGVGSPAACPSCDATLSVQDATAITIVTRRHAGAPFVIDRCAPPAEFLAEYRLGALLGSGGMGAVYTGVKLSTGRPVAVKFLRDEDGPEIAARFVREARLLARVCHPNVVRVLDLGAFADHLFIVTDLVEGGTLRMRLGRTGALAVPDALAVAIDIVSGLGACHGADIVHRDVKPENVLFDLTGRALLVDLGVARSLREGETLTELGERIGTPRYMSPEQILGRRVGPAADVYSIGLVIHEMLTGAFPFQATTLDEMLRKHLVDRPPDLRTVRAGLPEELCRIVDKALSKDPGSRHASAEQLLARLREIPESVVEPAGAGPAAPPRTPAHRESGPRSLPPRADTPRGRTHRGAGRRWSRRLRQLGVGLAVLILLSAAGVWTVRWQTRARSPDRPDVRSGQSSPQTADAHRSGCAASLLPWLESYTAGRWGLDGGRAEGAAAAVALLEARWKLAGAPPPPQELTHALRLLGRADREWGRILDAIVDDATTRKAAAGRVRVLTTVARLAVAYVPGIGRWPAGSPWRIPALAGFLQLSLKVARTGEIPAETRRKGLSVLPPLCAALLEASRTAPLSTDLRDLMKQACGRDGATLARELGLVEAASRSQPRLR